MQLRVQLFTVHKRFALTISRGTTAQTTNVWVTIEHDGIEGWAKRHHFRSVSSHKPLKRSRDRCKESLPCSKRSVL